MVPGVGTRISGSARGVPTALFFGTADHSLIGMGTPGRTRTCDIRIRNPKGPIPGSLRNPPSLLAIRPMLLESCKGPPIHDPRPYAPVAIHRAEDRHTRRHTPHRVGLDRLTLMIASQARRSPPLMGRTMNSLTSSLSLLKSRPSNGSGAHPPAPLARWSGVLGVPPYR